MYTPETILDGRAVDCWERASAEERAFLVRNVRGRPDPMLAILAEEAGMDALPAVLSRDEFDARAGQAAMFRGVSHRDHARQFREGAYWPGQGSFGSGTYAVRGKRRGEAIRLVERYSGEDGAILMLALDEGAVVMRLEDVRAIRDARREEFARYHERLLAYEAVHGTFQSAERLEIRARGADAIYANLGRFMAAHGIDALEQRLVENVPLNGSYFLIVNRSKVLVAREG